MPPATVGEALELAELAPTWVHPVVRGADHSNALFAVVVVVVASIILEHNRPTS